MGTRGPDSYVQAKVGVGLRNSGRGIALHPSVVIQPNGKQGGVQEVIEAGLARVDVLVPPGHPSIYRFSARGAEAVHPGMPLQAGVLKFNISLIGPVESLRLLYWVDCDGARDAGEVVIPAADLMKLRDDAFQDTFTI